MMNGGILTFAFMFRFTAFFAILFFAITLVSCRRERVERAEPLITVSIIPQKYLATFIAGGKFEVQVMQPAGSNHETYEPSPRDMEKISSSKLYLALGALDFELAWMDRFKASNPSMLVVNTSDGIEMIKGHTHETKNEPGGNRHGFDPHTWLSPSCMKIQAANICKALSANDTANSAFYRGNLVKFCLLADSVDSVIHEKLRLSKGKTVLIFHPALAYFARDYGLTQINIEQDGKEPSPSYLGELVKTAKEKGIKSVLISKEFDTRNAEAIAREIKGKVIVFDPMAENWAGNLIHLSELIAEN
jgi:zinc transport system substrate-binding protein